MKKDCKVQTLESMKLTKKQLQFAYCHGNLDTTIGELTLNQLRVALYMCAKQIDAQQKSIYGAINQLERCM